MRRGELFLLLSIAVFAGMPSAASDAEWRLADRTVARVDNTVVTLSDLRAEMEIVGWPGDVAPAGTRVVVRDMVKRKLLYFQAEKLRMEAPREAVAKEVDDLAASGRGEDAFWAQMAELGMGRADVEQRAREILLARNFVSLKKRAVYVPEADVRAFFRDNKAVFGDRQLSDVRDTVRDHLASRKYQSELSGWIDEQMRAGRVMVLKVPAIIE